MSKKGNEQEVEVKIIKKNQRPEILLAAIYLFSEHGRDKEVSRSELVECIAEFQKEFPLGYEFLETYLYSFELFTDLDNLFIEGYIHQYKYGRLLPKNFIALKTLGRGRAKKIIEALSPEIIEGLNKAIETAIKNYRERWGSHAR